MRRSDGHYRWFLFRGEPVHDASGATIRWFGSNTDIDDLKRSEEALRARERELQLNVDAIPTLVWCVSPEGEPEYINRQMSLYLYGDVRGVDRSESDVGTRLDRALGRLMHPDDLPSIQRKLSHSLRTGEPFAMRYRNRRADGAYRWVDARAEPLRDDNGRIVKWYGVSVDIDDEVKAQESLRTAQQELSRASQLAGLASGVVPCCPWGEHSTCSLLLPPEEGEKLAAAREVFGSATDVVWTGKATRTRRLGRLSSTAC